MKKIRLSESQLIDLIKKSLNDTKTITEAQVQNRSQLLIERQIISSDDLFTSAKKIYKNLDWGINTESLKNVYSWLQTVSGAFSEDGKCAIDKLLEYYKGYSYMGASLEDDVRRGSEFFDPTFKDWQNKVIQYITDLRNRCAQVDKEEKAANEAKKDALESCARKEKGFVDYGEGKGFGIGMSDKGYLTAWSNGAPIAGRPAGHNVTYWEYAKYHPKEGKDVKIATTKATCVNGELNLDAWVKY